MAKKQVKGSYTIALDIKFLKLYLNKGIVFKFGKSKTSILNRSDRIIKFELKNIKVFNRKISVHSANIYQVPTMCQTCSKY